ncbi:MAG TPA: glycoside hydrolase family 6 protein [Solirubrobacteraceae bacterium]|nr:glycoside hydrolase family 6 protein [Solirubrobacteraceae bacterium]
MTSSRLLRLIAPATLAGALLAAAPSAHAAPVTAEAEALSLPSGSGMVVSDSAASGGRALEIWSSATASGTVASRATRRIAVRARGQQCQGAPRMIVAVDGRTALDVEVPATSWTDYAADLALPDGPHAVTVRFANDFLAPACDRNLFVDRVLLTSVAARPLPGKALYVDPNTGAAAQAAAWRTSDPADAALLDKIASQPQAAWFGDFSGDVQSAVNRYVAAAAAKGQVPQLVAYDIPQRDCGSYSSGGATSADAYRAWIRAFAAGIGNRPAIVVLEPDALAGIGCLSAADQQQRYALLADAVRVLAASPGTYVYLDGGHDAWQPVATMAARLQQAGVADAQGFALDVSNFRAQPGLVSYGQAVAQALGVAHFVIDTSRNGLGPAPDGAWCNPPGRALGARPGTPSDFRLDWDLWVKRPGESDGTCNGGPAAGVFWPSYALGLAQRAAY